MKAICVFCGASPGHRPVYREAATKLGQLLAEHDHELVWGGGHIGLMGVVADAVLAAGGKTFGVIPGFMVAKELAHKASTELVETASMHERKALMAARADGFIAMPGGFGTLDELFEILTWAQLHIHRKPVGLLNVDGYFDPLLGWLRHAAQEGFIRHGHLDLLLVADTPQALLQAMRRYQASEEDWATPISIQQG